MDTWWLLHTRVVPNDIPNLLLNLPTHLSSVVAITWLCHLRYLADFLPVWCADPICCPSITRPSLLSIVWLCLIVPVKHDHVSAPCSAIYFTSTPAPWNITVMCQHRSHDKRACSAASHALIETQSAIGVTMTIVLRARLSPQSPLSTSTGVNCFLSP